MASIKGLAWNCAGLRSGTALAHQKALYFEKEYQNDFQVAFFVETHHKTESEIPAEILRYQNTHHIIHSTVSQEETHAGILGLVSKEYEVLEIKHLIQGRILNLKIKNKNDGTNHNISVVYLETNNHLTKAKIANVVEKLKQEKQDHSNNMIIGDFNFINHEKDKANGLNSVDKMATKIWQPFLEEMDMIDPYRQQNPKRRIWSFIGTGVAGKSRIDRIYVNTVNINNITKIQYIPTPYGGHKVLSFVRKTQNEKGKGYYKMNTSILNDQKYKELVEKTVEEIEGMQIEDDIEKWVTFLSIIKSKSISYSQTKNRVKKKLKKHIIDEIQKIEEALKEKENTRYAYLQQKFKEMEKLEIEGYKMRIKYLPSFEKDEPDIAFYSKLEQKKVAKDTITQIAETKNGEIYTDNENIMRISTQFYTSLYTPNKVKIKTQEKLLGNIKKKISQEQRQKLDAPITYDELKTAVFKMEHGKTPGLDGIPIEFYQEYWNVIKHIIIIIIIIITLFKRVGLQF